MGDGRKISIGGRVYGINPEVDRYQVDLNDLGDFRMNQIPPHSHVEVVGFPLPEGANELEVYGLNAGDDGTVEWLEVYGGISFKVPVAQRARIVARLRRAFPEDDAHDGSLPHPSISTRRLDDDVLVNVFLNYKFRDAPTTRLREAVEPYLAGFRRLAAPAVHAFICHATEDKETARQLAREMKGLGAEVWFDEWEIRVGESIVQRINDALGTVTHLVVLLSDYSVRKPWVRKELSSALMRQLSERSVTVLPVRLDGCSLPPILADVKYADARLGLQQVIGDIERALFASPELDDVDEG